jgi:DNA-3-methyladenine glycosylase I
VDWSAERIARFRKADVERLLGDAGIVRHRGKIEAVVGNARAALALDRPLSELLWSFVDGEPKVNRWKSVAEIPAQTAESAAMSKELKRRGFRFICPTTCYAFMQSAGLVDDHTLDCFRRG